MSTKQKEKEKPTVEDRTFPRALTDAERKDAQLFVPGHSIREPIHDTSGKELMSRKGEETELTTKTRLRAAEIPALATVRGLVDRINKKQQFCARCGRVGIPTVEGQDNEFKCEDKDHPTWRPYYWDSLNLTINELLAGRISLDGKEREEYIKHHEGTQTREKIDREVGPPSAQPVS